MKKGVSITVVDPQALRKLQKKVGDNSCTAKEVRVRVSPSNSNPIVSIKSVQSYKRP